MQAFLTEIFPKESQPSWKINEELKGVKEAARQRLIEENRSPIKIKDARTIAIEVQEFFGLIYKLFCQSDYIFTLKDKMACDNDFIPINLKTLYMFFTSDEFKNKNLPTYVKYINNIQAKVSQELKKKEYRSKFYQFSWSYYKYLISKNEPLQELFEALNNDTKNRILGRGRPLSWDVNGIESKYNCYIEIESNTIYIPLEHVDDNAIKFFKMLCAYENVSFKVQVNKMIYLISSNSYEILELKDL